MKIDPEFRYKELKDCVAGELVRLRNGVDLAIALGDQHIGHGIAIIDPQFQYRRIASSLYCVSFGADWIIEPIANEQTRPENAIHTEVFGSLHLTVKGVCIVLNDATEDGHGALGLTFPTLTIGDPPGHHSAPILRWKLWLSEAARERGEGPFFEFPPAAPAPAGS